MAARSGGDRSGDGGFVFGMLIGTALGAGLAVLFAPKEGAALRGDLAGVVDGLRQAAKERWDDWTAAASSVVDQGREAYDEAITAAEQAAQREARSMGKLKTP